MSRASTCYMSYRARAAWMADRGAASLFDCPFSLEMSKLYTPLKRSVYHESTCLVMTACAGQGVFCIQRLRSDQILDMWREFKAPAAVGRERKRNRPLFFLCSAFSAARRWTPFSKKLERIYRVRGASRFDVTFHGLPIFSRRILSSSFSVNGRRA